MAVQEYVPVESFLARHHDGTAPEADYVNGEIVERCMVEYPHSRVAIQLTKLFASEQFQGRLFPAVELRLRLAENHYRVVDFCVFEAEPSERLPATPPLLAVEILSRDDRFLEVTRKLEHYSDWGVKHVWLINPWTREFSAMAAGRLRPVDEVTLPGYSLVICPDDVFPRAT